MLALAEATGWSEEQILWRLPLSRGEQYYHVLCRRSRCRTYAPEAPAVEQIADLQQAAPQFDTSAEIEAAFARLFPEK